MDEFQDEPAYRKCRATLNSSAKLENLANSAKWEPPHGRFRHFFYPWSEYVKVGAVLRYCAYEVMALHGVLHSEIQAPYNLRIAFQTEILDATSQAAELLNFKLSETPLTKLNDIADFDSNSLEKNLSMQTGNLSRAQGESSHEMTRKQSRRMHSWPSREVDAFEDEGGIGAAFLPMRTLETTAALSLATFTSLLIEFVARLDHLVDAVNDLSMMAKFKDEGL
ncbi:hypothetical protein SLE2022_229580 [Rubroshorea leprosula]